MAEQIFEDDIEAAHMLAEKILGPNGNIVYPLTNYPNVRITSNKHGILWYGDLDDRQIDGLSMLSTKLGNVELSIETEN